MEEFFEPLKAGGIDDMYQISRLRHGIVTILKKDHTKVTIFSINRKNLSFLVPFICNMLSDENIITWNRIFWIPKEIKEAKRCGS